MKKWKINQRLYHTMVKGHSDDLSQLDVSYDGEIINNTVAYFRGNLTGLVYPAKSFLVGICYAKWIHQDFNENFLEVLSDSDLLFKNDPHFKPYHQSKDIYDQILSQVGMDFDESKGIIPIVRQYYLQEVQLIDLEMS